MNLGDFLWKKKRSYKQFGEAIDISPRSVSQYVTGEFSAGLLSALKIATVSEEEVSYVDLLSIKDLEKFDTFLDCIPQNYRMKELKLQIKETKKSRASVKNE